LSLSVFALLLVCTLVQLGELATWHDHIVLPLSCGVSHSHWWDAAKDQSKIVWPGQGY